MKRFSDKRIIKQISNNPIKNGDFSIHPITLEIGQNVDKFDSVATQFFIGENGKFIINAQKTTKNLIKSRNDKENMESPDLSLPMTDYLNIYNIDSYDELITSLKNMINKNVLEETIFRIVNIYVRIEFNELKKINNTLIKIFKIIFKNKKVEDDEFINKFLKNWFEKNNKDDFRLNICNDFKNYLG
jgi:hypothetical protein